MVAASRFVDGLKASGDLESVTSVKVELFGSLGATGHGHGSVPAVALGLMGAAPETVDPQLTPHVLDQIRRTGQLRLLDVHTVPFSLDDDIVLHRRKRLEYHSNAMTFAASSSHREIAKRTFYSIGGGFVVDHGTDRRIR